MPKQLPRKKIVFPKLKPIQFSKPQVFILESLTFEDEKAHRCEGRILADILRLCGKDPMYFYFRTEDELVELAKSFRASGYRYLHISCHGSTDSIHTTLHDIPFARFAEIFDGFLKNRRLFVSACSVGSGFFGELVQAKNKGIYSIASPVDKIRFDHAAALWAAFYVRMFNIGENEMKSSHVAATLQALADMWDVRFNWQWNNAKRDRWEQKVIAKQLAPAVGPSTPRSIPQPPVVIPPSTSSAPRIASSSQPNT